MARQVLPIVGAFVGAYFGNPQLGYAIGSIIGNAVDPLRVKGPTLKEIPSQTAGEGSFRQVVYGTCIIRDTNIIDFGEVERVKTETQQGKGGGPIVEGERLLRTYAIGLGEPFSAIRWIRRNGVVVYDVRPGSTILAESAAFAQRFRFYDGSETQLPDPDLEALPHNGVGNTPAYRGSAYLVFPRDDLTDLQGQIPTYEVEAARSSTPGSTGPTFATNIYHYTGPEDALVIAPNPIPWAGGVVIDVVALSPNGQYLAGSDANSLNANRFQLLKFDQGANTWTVLAAPADLPQFGPTSFAWHPTGQYLAVGINGGTTNRVWVYELVGDTLVKLAQPSPVQSGQSVNVCWSDDGLRLGCSNGSSSDNLYVYDFDPGTGVIDNMRGSLPSTGDQTGAIAFVPNTAGRYLIRGNSQTAQLVDAIAAPLVAIDTVSLPGAFSNMVNSAHFINDTDFVSLGASYLTNGPVGLWRVNVDLGTLDFVSYPVDKVPSIGATRGAALSVGLAYYAIARGLTGNATPYVYQVVAGELDEFAGFPATPAVQNAFSCSWRAATYGLPPEIFGSDTTLAAIIEDICERCGLPASKLDLSALEDIAVAGVTLGGQYGGAGAITTLMPAYFFDLFEADKKLVAVKRGGAVKATITVDDLVEEPDENSLRGQDTEYPRQLMVKYLNPGQNYAAPAAVVSRKTPDIRVRGEVTLDIPVSLTETPALQIADKILKVMWEDLNGEATFTLPLGPFAWLTPSDCLGYVARSGAVYRLRVEKVNDAAREITITARRDRQSAYTSALTAIPLPAPPPPPPSLPGVTQVALLNIPGIVDSDDQLGFRIGVCGQQGSAWFGAQVAYSTDGGLNWVGLGNVTRRAVMGELTAALPEASEFYTDSTNTLQVQLVDTDELETLTEEQFLSEGNGAAIVRDDYTAELVQFRDAEDLGSKSWALTTLLRGRLVTSTAEHAIGARFVMLETTTFLPLPAALIGASLKIRVTSLGSSPETAPVFDFDFAPAYCQQEFTVHDLQLTRGGGFIAGAWSPRPRFGTDVAPVDSGNFLYWRVTLTDGTLTESFDIDEPAFSTFDSAYTGPITVSVSGYNRFTGAGPSVSEII